jgi:hypothetical protein
LKGCSFRSFYRWVERGYPELFGGLPEQTRRLHSLRAHRPETARFLADPTLFTAIDSYRNASHSAAEVRAAPTLSLHPRAA